jgi:flagellin
MGLRINTNVQSLNAQQSLRRTSEAQGKALERMSSGNRINKAADDAAGLAVSEKLKADIAGHRRASQNALDGISFVQVAEGATNEVQNILTRFRELAIQAASDTTGQTEKGFLDIEFQQLKQEVQRISVSTEFNGTKLLNGSGGKIEIQVGNRNNDFEDRLAYNAAENSVTLEALKIANLGVGSKEAAKSSIEAIDQAITHSSGVRANLGAIQNRLNSTIQNLSVTDENLSAANSRIRDADYGNESAELARRNIQMQAVISVLSQANQSKGVVLNLLG